MLMRDHSILKLNYLELIKEVLEIRDFSSLDLRSYLFNPHKIHLSRFILGNNKPPFLLKKWGFILAN